MKLKKKVTLVPIANPLAWNQRIYYYTVGKFDLYKGSDWNRSYPGGETSLSARNSQVLFELAAKHEFVVDLHTARNSKPYVIYMDSTVKNHVKEFGLPYNYYIDVSLKGNGKFKGTLNQALLEKGVNSFTCECGSHDEYNENNVQMVYEGLLRLLENLNVIEMAPPSNKTGEQFVTEKIDVVYSPASGFVKYYVEPWKNFFEGDLLCKILVSSDLGEQIEVKAPYDGVMFELAKTQITWIGDELVRVIPSKALTALERL
jgi:predicted deacylase